MSMILDFFADASPIFYVSTVGAILLGLFGGE